MRQSFAVAERRLFPLDEGAALRGGSGRQSLDLPRLRPDERPALIGGLFRSGSRYLAAPGVLRLANHFATQLSITAASRRSVNEPLPFPWWNSSASNHGALNQFFTIAAPNVAASALADPSKSFRTSVRNEARNEHRRGRQPKGRRGQNHPPSEPCRRHAPNG